MSLRNPDLDKINTVFDKIDQEHKTLIDSMIDICVDSADTHNKFQFDTRWDSGVSRVWQPWLVS